jgi:hypothetical protein
MATRKKTDTSKAVEAVKETVKETAAEKIWEKIKNAPMDIFALPNQVVQMYVTRDARLEKAIPDAVHLRLKSAAVLPALEDSLGRIPLGKNAVGQQLVFDLSQMDVYTVVKIVPRI